MKVLIVVVLLTLAGLFVYNEFIANDEVFEIQPSSNVIKAEDKKVSDIESSTGINNKPLGFVEEDLEKTSENFTSESKKIDDDFSASIKNIKITSPGNEELIELFSSKKNAKKFLENFIFNSEGFPREANELAVNCFHQLKRKSYEDDNLPTHVQNYLEVLTDNCELLIGEKDIFFTLEKMAIRGDVNERLHYLSSLKSAINRYAVNPKVDPIGYMDRRDQGFNWLHSLASKGVGAAAAILSNNYFSGEVIEKDWALSYYYGDKALRSGNTSFPISQLQYIKVRLNEKELKKLDRISKGRLP